MQEHANLLEKIIDHIKLGDFGRNPNVKPTYYIPYIALVPKDFSPPQDSPVTTIPMYNEMSKKVSIKHLRKLSKDEQSEEGERRICLKWKLKIDFDKKGEATHGRECSVWRTISDKNEKRIFEGKDSNLLNSMGSMKWVVKSLTGGILN